MGMMKKIGKIVIDVLSKIADSAKEVDLERLEETVIKATPIIIKTINDTFNAKVYDDKSVKEIIDTKRSVNMLNDTLGYESDIPSFEILNYVNTISDSINKLMDELGEENVFIDELLIGYFIKKFNVPSKIVDKVERILEDKYAIENLSIRDGNIIIASKHPKKKDMRTPGGVMKVDKNSKLDNKVTNELYKKKMKQIVEESNDKKIKEFIGGK